jgi:hypothetical protein
VGPELLENEVQFYWEDPTGQKCLKIVFDSASEVVKGINVFGIRLRHNVCDQWLSEKKTVGYVVEHFSDANFDPEFSKNPEGAIIGAFEVEFPGKIARTVGKAGIKGSLLNF